MNKFIGIVALVILSGCYYKPEPQMCHCPACPTVSAPVATVAQSTPKQTTPKEDCTWYSAYVRNNWGNNGVLFNFVRGKNKYVNPYAISSRSHPAMGHSDSKIINNLNLTENETLNLCMNRIGTQEYTEDLLKPSDDPMMKLYYPNLDKAVKFEVIKYSTEYKASVFDHL